MIADTFFDRNPSAFAADKDREYDRIFHQVSSVIFGRGFLRSIDKRGICEYAYNTLCKELGVDDLMERADNISMRVMSIEDTCKIFIGKDKNIRFYKDSVQDFYRKKLSLVELIIRANENVLARHGKQEELKSAIEELNERLRRANFPYRYHGGVFQPADDDLSEAEIETPFWRLISAPIWKNVDDEMKDAFDTRANNGVDPAFHAAKALESAIKIVSVERGWSTGKEKAIVTFANPPLISHMIGSEGGRYAEGQFIRHKPH